MLRHVFGSHEAYWAIHKDGWYNEKFSTVLGASVSAMCVSRSPHGKRRTTSR